MKQRITIATLATTVVVAGSYLLGFQAGPLVPSKNEPLPPPFHTPSSTNRPQVVERPGGARLNVPAGFVVEEFATGFQRPRIMIYAPGGEILMSESIQNGSVVVLTDASGKPLPPDKRKTLISGLDRPYGLAWWKNYLYVAETTSLKRYSYDAKKVSVGKGEEIVPMHEFGRGHWTRTVAFDPKGEKLYLGIGSASNVDAGEPERRAAISRFNPDGSGFELFATGTRNPTYIGFYPGSTTLWASVQERDGLGDDLVPDYFTHVEQGAFYGWPYAYYGPNEDPRRKGEKPDLVKKAKVPDVSLGAHTAVIGWTFYTGKAFPQKYQGGAFLALHGSWNRSKRVGYSVGFVPFANGKPSGHMEDFLTGWRIDPSQRQVWGRPTGVLVMKDGSLLVSDDGGNKVWRITYRRS